MINTNILKQENYSNSALSIHDLIKVFNLILRLRSSFKYNTTFAIRSSVLFNNCSKRLAMLWRKCTVVHPLDYLNVLPLYYIDANF